MEIALNEEFCEKSLGDLLKGSFTIYQTLVWKLAGIVAVTSVPLFLISLPPIFIPELNPVQGFYYGFIPPVYSGIHWATEVLNWIIIVLGIPLTTAAAIHAVSTYRIGGSVGVWSSYQVVLKRIWSLLGTHLMMVIFLGLMAVTVIGLPVALYMGVRWGFIYPTILLKKVGGMDALSESSRVVKGDWWRVFGFLLLISIIGGAITYGLTFIPYYVGSLIAIFTSPFHYIFVTLLYFDLRVRKDGYDVDQLSAELGFTDSETWIDREI
jgi:hypothetical protein